MAKDVTLRELHRRRAKNKSPLKFTLSGLAIINPGGFLLSHAVARAVPSAPRGLTSVFGMGTGVTLSTKPPENLKRTVRSHGMKRGMNGASAFCPTVKKGFENRIVTGESFVDKPLLACCLRVNFTVKPR